MSLELIHNPVPDFIICNCVDGVVAISQSIHSYHTASLQDVVKTYSRTFNCLVFLRTDASTQQLECLTTQPHGRDALWELAEPSPPLKCWSFPQILAVAAAGAVGALGVRRHGGLMFDSGLRALRWRLQDMCKEANSRWMLPERPSSGGVTSCGYRDAFHQGMVFKDCNGGRRISDGGDLSLSAVTVRASMEQMLWLSQWPNFSPLLLTLQDHFGATEIGTEHFLALQVAWDIGTFEASVEGWLESIDVLIRELERMLLQGVVIPEL